MATTLFVYLDETKTYILIRDNSEIFYKIDLYSYLKSQEKGRKKIRESYDNDNRKYSLHLKLMFCGGLTSQVKIMCIKYLN